MPDRLSILNPPTWMLSVIAAQHRHVLIDFLNILRIRRRRLQPGDFQEGDGLPDLADGVMAARRTKVRKGRQMPPTCLNCDCR